MIRAHLLAAHAPRRPIREPDSNLAPPRCRELKIGEGPYIREVQCLPLRSAAEVCCGEEPQVILSLHLNHIRIVVPCQESYCPEPSCEICCAIDHGMVCLLLFLLPAAHP